MIDRQNPATPEPGAPPDSWSAESVSGAPMPRAPEGAREHHPELYAAWVKGIEAGYLNNQQVFQRVLDAFLTSHRSTVIMYWIIFVVGIAFFVTAVVLALVGDQPVVAVAFGGLSVAAFLTYFLTRPTQALEENLFFITWLGMIYNSYWTHLNWASDPETADQVLEQATTKAVEQIQVLLDRYTALSGRRPGSLSDLRGGGGGAAPNEGESEHAPSG